MDRMNGTEVKSLRERLGLTYTELAAKIGVSGDAVRKWETIEGAKPNGSATILLRQIEEQYAAQHTGKTRNRLVATK